MCKQRDNETDREYLTRWSKVRNSCEGVVEEQAISWFAQGCRHGSMLWQKLQREMPATLAETIRIADSYALGDPMQPLFDSVEPNRRFPARGPGPARRDDRQEFGVKRGPGYQYGVNQVAAIEQGRPDAGSSQRQKTDVPAWGQN